MRLPRFLILSCVFSLFAFCFVLTCLAEEITILYTGSTHAMLYHCGCPIEPDGGVGRRSTLINELRNSSPNTLVLDSGAFFAGGLFDEYTQNTDLDLKRTTANVLAMELMKYDAVNISDVEFSFGRKFLEDTISGTKIPFLSCNIKSDKVKPFIIKEVGSVKIGIIGASAIFPEQKAGGIKITGPEDAVRKTVAELKKNNADIIIMLSYGAAGEDYDLIKNVDGIDILIESTGSKRSLPVTKVGSTIVATSFWQGKRLGKLDISIKDRKIVNYGSQDIRLSDKISDDPALKAVVPQCFSDANCKKNGSEGTCRNPGELKAGCFFPEGGKVNVFVITPKDCLVCNPEQTIDYLKGEFPGIAASYLYYPGKRSQGLMKDLGIKALPAFVFGKEIEKEKKFESFKRNLEDKGDYYLAKVEFTGISYYPERPLVKGKLDLFVSLYQKETKDLLDLVKEYKPEVHFLAVYSDGVFDAAKGQMEVEEYLRGVCVQKHYPDRFWDYIGCRAKNINTSWWDDCLPDLNLMEVKSCAKGGEGASLLKENITLNRELQVMLGPVFLLDNRQVFGFKILPSKEQLRKILKR